MKEERIQAIFDEVSTLVISLGPDPASLGPAYLQERISLTRGYLNQTSNLLTEVLREMHARETLLESNEAAFQVTADDLLANDDRVKNLPAVTDRLAMVNVILRVERREITKLEGELKGLRRVERVVQHRYKELEGTMSAIRLQRGLLQVDTRLGGSYGDETETSRGKRLGGAAPPTAPENEEDLEKILADAFAAQGGTPPPVVAPPAPPPEVLGVVDEDPQITRFLDGDPPDDLFDGIDLGQ